MLVRVPGYLTAVPVGIAESRVGGKSNREHVRSRLYREGAGGGCTGTGCRGYDISRCIIVVGSGTGCARLKVVAFREAARNGGGDFCVGSERVRTPTRRPSIRSCNGAGDTAV